MATSPQTLKASLPGLRRILSRFAPQLRAEKRRLAGAFAALFTSAGLALLEPWPLKYIFDHVIFERQSTRVPNLPVLERFSNETALLLLVGALLVISCGRAIAEYVRTVLFAKVGNRVLMKVRNKLFRHVEHLPLSFHHSARGGDLVIRIISDVNMLRDAVVTAALPIMASAVLVVGMWSLMLYLNWRLALLGAVSLPLLAVVTRRTGTRIRAVAREQRRREGALASTAAETVTSIKAVQALSLEDRFGEEFTDRSEDSQKQDIKAARLSAALERGVDLLLAISTALVMYAGVKLVLAKSVTPGELLVFLTYLRRAFNPVQDFAKYTGRIAKAVAAGERVLDLLDQPANLPDESPAASPVALRGHIRFDDVTFGYNPAHPVLHELSFEASPGRRLAIVGPSGAGKSTVTNLLLKFYEPAAGLVTIDGIPLHQIPVADLRRQASVVLQETALFAGTLRDNIAFGASSATGAPPAAADILDAARLANIHDFIASLPQGYDTPVGERGVTLSGGQRQRIAIARAILRRAPILILDEPTSGLDEENRQAVLEAIERAGLAGGGSGSGGGEAGLAAASAAPARTTLLITHDLHIASRADHILYLEAGRLLEQGTHAELLDRGGRYAALFTLQTSPAAPPAPSPEEPSHAVA